MSETLLASRLKFHMQKSALNSVELARQSDVKTSFIYDILNGKSANPSTLKLARVADVLGVSLEYLAGGASVELSQREQPDFITIPRISVSVSAGGGAVVTTEHEAEYYYFRRGWIRDRLNAKASDLRMVYVSGDSMEPTLQNQDIILIDTGSTLPTPPGVFVLFDGFGLMAKRLELCGTENEPRLRVISDNPQYSTFERALDEVRIIGRVVWFAREM